MTKQKNDEWKQRALAAFERFLDTVAQLRDPASGCPWDLQQTHESLRRYMIEEAYEAAAAMAGGDAQALKDELGDVLLQVVLNAQLARDAGRFQIADVIEAINSKMRRRHPHVFAQAEGIKDAQDVRRQWEVIKSTEKEASPDSGIFSNIEGKGLSALMTAVAIGKVAKRIDFDWDGPREVLTQLVSEVSELQVEVEKKPQNQQAVKVELSDILFTTAQLCRHFNLDPEVVAQDGNLKFLARFAQVEALAEKRGIALTSAERGVKEKLWQEAKKKSPS